MSKVRYNKQDKEGTGISKREYRKRYRICQRPRDKSVRKVILKGKGR
jgi:hypothetical protein